MIKNKTNFVLYNIYIMNTNTNKITKNNQTLLTINLIGPPNAGKSTLANLLTGEKISTISPKAHTTIKQIIGIHTTNNFQLILLDNPGFTHNNTNINNYINENESDYLCLIIDATHPWQYNIKKHITHLIETKTPFTIIINKADLIPKNKWIELIETIKLLEYKNQIWIISALYNKGVEPLLQFLESKAKKESWWFDPKTTHTQTRQEIITECIREKIFHLTHKEVPYGIELQTEEIKFNNRTWKAIINLKTQRIGQKAILIGKNGETIKAIGQAARIELCHKFGKGSLFLKVR